jgi:hypothetical protein
MPEAMNPMPVRFHLGTLTRYYAENGGVGDSNRETDPEVIAGAVTAWRHWLNKELPHNLDWDESPTAPFDTADVGDTDWGAVWTLVAYGAPGRPDPPTNLPHGWADNRFVQEVQRDAPEWDYLQTVLPDLWLPGDHDLLFRSRDLRERETWIGASCQIPEHFRQLERMWGPWLDSRPNLKAGFERTRTSMETLARRSVSFGLPLMRSEAPERAARPPA